MFGPPLCLSAVELDHATDELPEVVQLGLKPFVVRPVPAGGRDRVLSGWRRPGENSSWPVCNVKGAKLVDL